MQSCGRDKKDMLAVASSRPVFDSPVQGSPMKPMNSEGTRGCQIRNEPRRHVCGRDQDASV